MSAEDDDQRLLKIGLPKGSLEKPTFDLLSKAGYDVYGSSRSYRPSIDDPELRVRLLRAQEIGRYVHQGFLDCGITGRDWVAENEADVEVLTDLPYSRATANPTRWVLVVPEDSPVQSVQDLEGKLISTEALNLTRNFLKENGVEAQVEFSWGATEVKVPDLVDAIVDITETGSSLRANKLRIVATLMESFPQFVANREAAADPWKRAKMERIVLLLKGALEARGKVGLKMNVPEKQLQSVLQTLPSLRLPTVAHLSQEGWLAIETVLEEKVVREIIPDLKAHGAEGIIEYPLNKVVH